MRRKRMWHVGPKGDRYRTAIRLWGRWRIHIFWRGDKDRAPHDHPNDFWTFPLRGYWERVYHPQEGYHNLNYVEPFRWHYRSAEYAHMVLGARRVINSLPDLFFGGFITLVKEEPERRSWGFWTWDPELYKVKWVYWRKYLGQESRNPPSTEHQEKA